MRTFDEAALGVRLPQLAPEIQSAFAQGCAWRTVNARSKDNDTEVRSLCISVLTLLSAPSDTMALAKIAEVIEAHEELDEDALAACAYALRHKLNGNLQDALWTARRAYEACDAFAQVSEELTVYTPEVEKRLLANTRVQWELENQAADLESLSSLPSNASSVVTRAKTIIAP